jgi:hypothetical protein
MTAQHQSYITLDSCISDYMNEAEQSNHKYYKLFHIAFRGLEDLGLDFFYQVKSVKLPINANLTVTLPADYLNWTKVGVLNSEGEIIPLYYNKKLTTYADLSPDRLTKTQDDTLLCSGGWGVNTWCNYWNGYSYVNIYGVPSGSPFVGSFKVDNANGVILLDENYQYDYLMIEYVASPKEGEEYYLPMQFREALISWIAWKDIRNIPAKTHVHNNSVGARRKDYYNERRNAIAKWKPGRISEQYQASQEQSRMAIKS